MGSDGSPYEKRVDAEGRVLSEKCIADEVPFEKLPEGWAWARLETLVLILNGDRGKNYPAKSKLHKSGIPFVSAINIERGVVTESNMLYLNESQYEALRAGQLQKGDSVFCIRGSLGKHGVFPFDKGAIASSLVVVRLISSEVLHETYLELLFDSPLTFIGIRRFNNGTAQPNLAARDFGSFLYALPPLAEQRRIVKRVGELMPLVDDYGKLEDAREALDAALPDRLRKSVLQMAVQGKLVPQDPADEPASVLLERIREQRRKLIAEKKVRAPKGGESVIYTGSDGRRYEKRIDKKGCIVSDKCIENEIPFDIPDGWAWTRLPGIVNIGIGKTPSRHEPEYWLNGTVPWFSISDMNDGETVFKTKEKVSSLACENCFKSELVSAGTLLMSFKLTIGKTSIMGVDGVHNEAIVSIAPYIDKADALRDYLLWVLPLFAKGGNTKSAIKGATLNSKSLAALLIPLPPLAEQQRIVEQIQALVSLAV